MNFIIIRSLINISGRNKLLIGTLFQGIDPQTGQEAKCV